MSIKAVHMSPTKKSKVQLYGRGFGNWFTPLLKGVPVHKVNPDPLPIVKTKKWGVFGA
jgi:hypothetical protein